MSGFEGQEALSGDTLRRFSLVSCVPNEETAELYIRYRRART